ncbi:phospholipase C [Paraburkholderia sp. Clong3]|uniref:alkaline phosphatase family protein n=1 Tax=unclassified Paraburkholderia TaxID=2615204 RepID=UPI001613B5C5|nr:alkaline phosphatase family protein [Paraburkholderia sp. CI2]MBB5471006.1 phospholipase C [Paraburkholderia sp. CI2]
MNAAFMSVKHIVVLMLENRSFDHMLGYLYADQGNRSPGGQPFEGLTGDETNQDSAGNRVSVFKIAPADQNAYFMPGADPGEGYVATNMQLFGVASASSSQEPGNGGFVRDYAQTLQWEARKGGSILPGTTGKNIMGIFTPDMLPVLSGLARGFAVCDHWYASAPTETMPNRAFACAATSQGHMDDVTKTFTCPSIFGRLTDAGQSWAIYGYDTPPLTRHNFPDVTNAPESHFGLFTDFQAASKGGTLPAFSFLEPGWSPTGNSQHPNYDVALGEQLIYEVYQAVSRGPNWNQTLLIVTYDEHGGCYDHVPPPSDAVPPDSLAGEYGFDFRRFGVRIPTVLISPWIEAGTVFRVPDGAMPLDHTSILKTAQSLWGMPALTARDAAAPDVSGVFTRTAPRTDDPLAGVTVPTSGTPYPGGDAPSHLQVIHAELVSQLPVADDYGHPHAPMPALKTSQDYTQYIRTRTEAWIAQRQRQSGDATN